MILQIDAENNVVGKFTSTKEASDSTKVDDGNIRRAIRNGTGAGGYKWQKMDDSVESIKIWETHDGRLLKSVKISNHAKKEAFFDYKKELLEEISNIASIEIEQVTEPTLPTKARVMVSFNMPDVHFSAMIDNSEGSWDTNIAANTIREAVSRVIMSTDMTNVELIVFPVGNDGLNSEGMRRTTTKGTPQVDSVTWQKAFILYQKALIEAILTLSQKAKVHVPVVPGNHDFETSFYIGEVLSAYFHGSKRVTIDNGISNRKYVRYGKTLILYTHGDKEKANELPVIMATERPVDFTETTSREVHMGHIHKEKGLSMNIQDTRGIKLRYVPSIVPTACYAHEHGWSHKRATHFYLYEYDMGFFSMFEYTV